MSQISFINRMDGTKEEIESDIKEVATGALDSDWSPPASFPDHYKEAKVISIDLETRDPNLMTLGPGWARDDGYIIGYAVAFNNFCGYYPIRHEGGGNLPEAEVVPELLSAKIERLVA